MADTTNTLANADTQLDQKICKYLASTKGWRPEDFRIEHKGRTEDGRLAIVWAVHLDDEGNAAPWSGKSVVLHITTGPFTVVRELKFQ